MEYDCLSTYKRGALLFSAVNSPVRCAIKITNAARIHLQTSFCYFLLLVLVLYAKRDLEQGIRKLSKATEVA